MKSKTKKCIKGFDSELKCLGFQYEVGKSYKLPEGEQVKICENGFHAIDEDENPLEVFRYYSPCGNDEKPSRYCEVKIGGEIQKQGAKIVGSEIKIMREIGIQGVIDAHKEWLKRHSKVEVSKENADCSMVTNNGYRSVVSDNGDYSVAANTGNYSVASNTGYGSVASNTGNGSVASNTGWGSVASNTGNYSVAFNIGNDSVASNTGENSIVVINGFNSSASIEGEGGIALAGCNDNKVKGAIGCAIMAVERGDWNGKCYPILSVAASVIDGVKVKADTWYKCVNGELIEAR